MRSIAPTIAATCALLALASNAAAAPYRPGEVVVKYAGDAAPTVQRVDGSVKGAAQRLDQSAGVDYAVPNYVAHAAGFMPNDRGRRDQGWERLQWNFLSSAGVDAPGAWSNMIAAGRPGGKGATVAVLDTGVAYENRGRFRRSPDFARSQFVRGYDFVNHDPHPDDYNGHGTFVTGTIGERTNNRLALTGLAYGAKLMPVRVLDADGLGDASDIAAGIRYAARHHAQVINLSLEFDTSVPGSEIPEILSAVRYASHRGVVIVAAAGNEADTRLAYPARAAHVISVGATTSDTCQADYSNDSTKLDLVAPGGGADADLTDDPHCHPTRNGRDIYQLTFPREQAVRTFSYPGGYEGTSMAAPHVAAAAALVIASGVIGRHPSALAVAERLKATSRDLGKPGRDNRYGSGLLDAATATATT